MVATFVDGVIVDHIGAVCADVHAAVARYRARGFLVSDPVALMAEDAGGAQTPLGQDSAHIVFEDGYLELSAPWPGHGNHLDRYLTAGPGVRILCFRSLDIEGDHARLTRLGIAGSPVQASARTIRIDGRDEVARFRWIAVSAGFWPGVLVAVVQHLTPELVFAPPLARHPNGSKRLSHVVAAMDAPSPSVLRQAFSCDGPGPRLSIEADAAPLPIAGIVLAGEKSDMAFDHGYYVRTLVDAAAPENVTA
jgi:catechol 2,3-dioxygenase-like lactoylglutathione lyase family enzyme